MDIIKALKENEKAFGLMSKEMQAKAEKVSRDCLQRFDSDGRWKSQRECSCIFNGCTYRLRPDYQEKPRIVECEVEPYKDLGLCYLNNYGARKRLHKAPTSPDFIGFKYADGFISINSREYAKKHVTTSSMLDSEVDDYEVLTPTHVCFHEVK